MIFYDYIKLNYKKDNKDKSKRTQILGVVKTKLKKWHSEHKTAFTVLNVIVTYSILTRHCIFIQIIFKQIASLFLIYKRK